MYKDVKHEYNTARMEQLNIAKQLKCIENELNGMASQYAAIDSRYDGIILSDRASALEAFRTARTAPLEQQLSEVEAKLTETQSRYDEERSKITYDNLISSCSSKQEILQNVREASEALEGQLRGMVGDRFYDALTGTLTHMEVNFNDANLNMLIGYFNHSEKVVDALVSGKSATAVIDGIEENLLGADEDSLQAASFIAIVILALLLFANKIFMPLLTLFVLALLTYNIFKHYQIYHILVVQKAVCENIDKIDSFIKKQVEDEVQRCLEELDSEYLSTIEGLTAKKDELSDAIRQQLASADEEFQYDGTTVNREKVAEIDKLDAQKRTLEQRREECRRLCDEKAKFVAELKEKMDSMLADLKDTFLTGIGKECIFEPTFLLDIDDESKPRFFNHPQGSCLFLYEDVQDVYSFIRLISFELRAKLSPFSLKVAVSDETYLGQDFIYFTNDDETNKAAGSAYSIFRSKDETKDFVNNTNTELRKRQVNIHREFQDIAAYNKAMLKMGSMTESYLFWFYVDPPVRELEGSALQQILKIGGSLGIFSHLFISKSEFVKLKDLATQLFDCIDQIYYVEHAEIYMRSVAFVTENLLE